MFLGLFKNVLGGYRRCRHGRSRISGGFRTFPGVFQRVLVAMAAPVCFKGSRGSTGVSSRRSRSVIRDFRSVLGGFRGVLGYFESVP